MQGLAPSYSQDDTISANCSTYNSLPVPKLSWYINGDILDTANMKDNAIMGSYTSKLNNSNGLVNTFSNLNLKIVSKFCKVKNSNRDQRWKQEKLILKSECKFFTIFCIFQFTRNICGITCYYQQRLCTTNSVGPPICISDIDV